MNDIKRLPDAEQEVMQALWECEAPATRADIEKHLFIYLVVIWKPSLENVYFVLLPIL